MQRFGCGIGDVATLLLACVHLNPGTQLWSRDGRLVDASQRLGDAFGVPTRRPSDPLPAKQSNTIYLVADYAYGTRARGKIDLHFKLSPPFFGIYVQKLTAGPNPPHQPPAAHPWSHGA